MKIFKKYSSLCCGLALLAACMPLLYLGACVEEDNAAPIITLASPTNNMRITAGDTLLVVLSVTDDEEVLSVNLSLLDQDFQPILTQTVAVNAAEKEVRVAFPIEDPSIEDGEYVLMATAYDSDQSTKASVTILINQADLQLSNYLVWSNTEVTTYSKDFSAISSVRFEEPITKIEVKDAERSYLVLLQNGELQYRDLLTNEKIWSSKELSSSSTLNISHFTSDRFFCYLSTSVGTFEKWDNLGRLRVKTNDIVQPLFYTSTNIDEVITLGNGALTAVDKELLITSAHNTITKEPLWLYDNNNGSLFTYSATDGQGALYVSEAPHRRFEKVTAAGQALSDVLSGVAVGNKHYLLQQASILVFELGTVSLFATVAGTAKMLAFDPVNAHLWVVTDDRLLQFTNTEVPKEVLTGSNGLAGISIVYNY